MHTNARRPRAGALAVVAAVALVLTAGDARAATPILPPMFHITAIAPAVGPVEGGQTVIIRGSGLHHVDRVDFGVRRAPWFVVHDPTTIEAVTPSGTPGTVYVIVRTRESYSWLPSGYTYADVIFGDGFEDGSAVSWSDAAAE